MNSDEKKAIVCREKQTSEKEKFILYNINNFSERLTPITGKVFNSGDNLEVNDAGDTYDAGDLNDAGVVYDVYPTLALQLESLSIVSVL